MVTVRGTTRARVPASWVRAIALRTLKASGSRGGNVSITFVTDAQIGVLNAQYRGKRGPTDILSFDTRAQGLLGERSKADKDLGDIIISPQSARRKAKARGEEYRAYLALLVVHGVLHLVGYDHEHERDAEKMERAERKILTPKKKS